MYENIDFDNIDLTQNPPQEEPDRQYYYIAKGKTVCAGKKPEKGTASYILRQYLWMSDECEGFRKINRDIRTIGYVKKRD